jgi:tRNA uridine 5-carbamoylmethylation protein Kti12
LAEVLRTNLLDLEIFQSVEVIHFDDYIEDKSVWNDSSYRRGRDRALSKLTERIQSNQTEASLDNAAVSTGTKTYKGAHAIIVDDLNYLRSMRREIYALGRDNYWSTVILWVNTPVEIALERNKTRSHQQVIDEVTICKVAENFESPDKSHFLFDKLWYMIDGTQPITR